MKDEIKTERLVLRPFLAEDGDTVVRVLDNFDVSKWLARVPHPFTHADLRLFGEDGSTRWPELMAVTLQDSLIGAISTDHFGYWYDIQHWGNGYATEAGRAALDFAFTYSNRTEMPSGYFAGNEGSARVLEKLGFRHVSTYPFFNRARNEEIENHDMVLTRTEWEARQ